MYSINVDALKFHLVRHYTFYNGQNEQDSTECLLMLIIIILKGSLPDSNSKTFPMGASISDMLFSFVLGKYIVCDVCGLRSPSFESTVCYIFHLLIPLPCKTFFYKDCNINCKNTVLDVIRTLITSNQAIYYNLLNLLLFVNRFRYINNNATKYRCSIPTDTTVRFGPLKFSLRATIDHHGPSMHSGHDTVSINCCKNILLQRSHNYGVWNYWQPKLLYCICYAIWIDLHMIFGLEQEGESLIAPMALAHPLHPIDNRSRNRRRNLWVGWCVSSWWPLLPSRSSVLINIYIYIYVCALLYEFCFLWFTICVLLSDDNGLIPGCLWLLAFVLNNTLILGIWCSTIPHIPGCFCPWTFFQNIGFNMVPSDPFMSHLATQLGYSAGEFQDWLSLRRLVSWIFLVQWVYQTYHMYYETVWLANIFF